MFYMCDIEVTKFLKIHSEIMPNTVPGGLHVCELVDDRVARLGIIRVVHHLLVNPPCHRGQGATWKHPKKVNKTRLIRMAII